MLATDILETIETTHRDIDDFNAILNCGCARVLENFAFLFKRIKW